MSEQLRAAVIGTGFIGPAHVEALRRLGIEVVGIAGSSPERARAKTRGLNLPRVYDSWQELVADPAVDVVHITTPNHLHFPMTQAAIAAGKHVVCEKPLAMNAQESAEMLRLATQAGIVHATNYNQRYYPLCQEAHARVRRGDLGSIFLIHGGFLQDWLLYEADWDWRVEAEQGGGLRAVSDIGTHWLDLVTFVAGLRVEAVMAELQTVHPVRRKPVRQMDLPRGVVPPEDDLVERAVQTEDSAMVMLRFSGGAKGVMLVSQISAGRKNWLHFEISGSKSAVAWNAERPNELWIGQRNGPNEILIKDPTLVTAEAGRFASYPSGHAEGFPDTFKQLYSAVYGYIKGDRQSRPEFPTFADGHEQMLLLEAISESARTRQWVTIAR